MSGSDSPSEWHGVLIAEGLTDPTTVNGLRVRRAQVSRQELPVDDDGRLGRWHLYWVVADDAELGLVQSQTRHGWYAHFWRGDQLVVLYDDARFDLTRHDTSTWGPAVDHGLGQGLRREWLDFPTDDSIGDLEDQ